MSRPLHAQRLAKVPKGSPEMVAAAIRTIFAQPDREAVAEQLASIADKLGRQFPAVEQMLVEAAPDICAFAAFPQSHWRRVWSTNPLERVNGEIKRRDLPQQRSNRAAGGSGADRDP